jgi:uncharacterized membrane-anchored protein
MAEDRDFTSPVSAATLAAAIYDPVSALGPPGHLGPREEIEKELDLIAAAIRTFHRKNADQVLRECSGYSARLTEMAVLLHRVEGASRQYTRIRTQQVERFLAELDRQWKTASRLIEVQRQDMELMK